MTLKIVVQLRSSCETFKCARQKHQMTTCREGENVSLLLLLFSITHPNIEVDFFDDATAIVQVQAQLVQAQALL